MKITGGIMEELKLILETVSELGGSAKWLFIIYTIKGFLVHILVAVCVFYGLHRGFYLFENSLFVGKVAEKLGFELPLLAHEKRRIMEVFNKGLKNENNQNP